jgi:hypothetical protein
VWAPGTILWAVLVLRADPWAPDHGMGFDAAGQDEPAAEVDASVETADWSAPLLCPASECAAVFVDGVRRVELRLVAQDGGKRVVGLFGSFAVGSVVCDGQASFGEELVGRSVVLAGGMVPARVELDVGSHHLAFEPATDQRQDPNAPLERLQRLMREAEANLAVRTVVPGAVALVDGPLNFYEEPGDSVVGVIKRFVRRYLGPEEESLLARLGPGERTPVFALLDRTGAPRLFSWYSRVAPTRAPWHDHAGIVRCEVGAGVGADRAMELAGLICGILPAYAGRASDPRTPQNLTPVAALEARLRHRLGDYGLIRRALLELLSDEER